MELNDIYFKHRSGDDDISPVEFVFGGNSILFTSMGDRKFTGKNRAFLVNGLNHLLNWAKAKAIEEEKTGEITNPRGISKNDFLTKLGLFILNIYTNLTSAEFTMEVNEKMKADVVNEKSLIKGEIYARYFDGIDEAIVYTILEYVDECLEYNSRSKISPGTVIASNLTEIEITMLVSLVVVGKLIALGTLLLGTGKIAAHSRYCIHNFLSRLSDNLIGRYLYSTGDTVRYEMAKNRDCYNSFYSYIANMVDEQMENNIRVTQMSEKNGRSRKVLQKEIIGSGLANAFKIVPILYEREDTTIRYESEDNFEDYKYTSRNTINFFRSIIKIGHKNQNISAMHTNVAEDKRNPTLLLENNINVSHNRQELILETRDAKDLEQRRKNVEMLESYIEKYFNKNNITDLTVIADRNDLTDYFVAKILREISEDYATLKILHMNTYSMIVNYASAIIKEDYPTVSLALKSQTASDSMSMMEAEKIQWKERIKELPLYVLDPQRCEEHFFKIVGKNYHIIIGNGNGYMADISEDFFRFLINNPNLIKDYIM